MKNAWTNLERQTFAALCTLRSASVNELVDAHLTTTRSACNIRYALGKLTEAGFACQVKRGKNRRVGVWTPRIDADLPIDLLIPSSPPKSRVRAPQRDFAPLAHSTIAGSMPDELAVHFTLAGMVADQIQHPLRMRRL